MIDGYKTYIGGIGFILTGIAAFAIQWYNGDPIQYEVNLGLIATGWSIIGFRSAVIPK